MSETESPFDKKVKELIDQGWILIGHKIYGKVYERKFVRDDGSTLDYSSGLKEEAEKICSTYM